MSPAAAEATAMIVHATARMDDRLVARARRAGLRWRAVIEDVADAELIGLYVVAEVEMERRALLDRPGRRGGIRT